METASVRRPRRRFDFSDDEIEQRAGVSWDEFVAFTKHKRDAQRVTYLDGELEVMSPGMDHEAVRSLIGMLLERYFCELGVEFAAVGSWLQRIKALRIGIEPDESYIFASTARGRRHVDLAIEVIATSGSTRKLEVYRRLGVPEVWFWIRGSITIYERRRRGYAPVPRSRFVPGLEPALLERLLHHTSGLAAVNDLLAALARDRRAT
jgi:Uma2 family endonuclease